MVLRNLVVAETKVHAEAIIRWRHLDPETWTTVIYGTRIGRTYDHVILVPPLQGIDQWQLNWCVETLLPKCRMQPEAVPIHPPDHERPMVRQKCEPDPPCDVAF